MPPRFPSRIPVGNVSILRTIFTRSDDVERQGAIRSDASGTLPLREDLRPFTTVRYVRL